jgi:aspartate aminotransferase-like enzyme
MQDKLTLMIPGPTPVPETVLLAMSRHPIGHRSADFQAIVKRTTAQLKWLHQTSGDVLVLAGGGDHQHPQPRRQGDLRRQRQIR